MLLYLAAASDVPVEESGPNPVIPNGGELVIGLITFAVVVFVLMKYVWPRMEATFQARRDAIEGGIKRAEEAQAEAQRLLGEYRQQLAEARTEAAQIRDNARAEGQRIIEEMRTTAQEESARIVARGDEQLTVQRQQVVRELRGEIGTLATSLAERVVGESLADDAARRRTIDRFLDDLDGMADSVPVGVGAGPAGGDPGAATGGSGAGSPAPAPGSGPAGGAGAAAPETGSAGASGSAGGPGDGSGGVAGSAQAGSDPAGGAQAGSDPAGTVSPSGAPVADPPAGGSSGASRADGDDGSGGGRTRRRRP